MSFSDDDSRSSEEELHPFESSSHPSIAAKTLRYPVEEEASEDSASMRGDVSMDMDVSMNTPNGEQGYHYEAEDDNGHDLQSRQHAVERPRGKVLRLPPRDDSSDDDDDDDDIQVAAVVADTNGENDDFSIAETSFYEDTSIATPFKDTDGDDRDLAVAEVVMDGNESENSEVAAVVAEVVPKKVRKKPGPKPKNKDGTKKGSDKRHSSGDLRRKRTESGSYSQESVISQDELESAQKARDILLNSMKETPFHVSDSHVIQNFGRVVVENDDSVEPLFSNPTSLFPVGFCCDRYEFSPVHGRVIKLKCEILNRGEMQTGKGIDEAPKSNGDEKKRKKNKGKGPVFRITWGQGIDELQDGKPFPFDLYSASAPLGGDVDTVAVPMGLDVPVIPEPGMRAKVRFDDDVWYHGTIKKAYKKKCSQDDKDNKKKGTRSASKKGNKSHYVISISYDDGMKEEIVFPDPDIMLISPGSERIDDGKAIDINEVRGKPVMSVHGKSPLEAWANALIKIGLIDEVMYEKALESIETARIEGMKEVKDRMDTLKRQRQEARARQLQKQKETEGSQSPIAPQNEDCKHKEGSENDAGEEIDKEPSTDKEKELIEKAEELKAAYETRFKDSQKLAISLADARIAALGPFLSNPFYGDETQQKTWLTTIIKKEKSKMGSTGNKRKIVTPTDILDRNATFYNLEIEHLLEGLPGSEFCTDYVFYDLRGNGASQYSFVHEVKVRKEREKVRRTKRAQEKEARDFVERDKVMKRKARDDEREVRKKQKTEELDQQKKARQEERLSRLSTQVDERLFKEACFQRERVVLLASKLCGKEISRRKKASETVTAYAVENTPPYTEDYSSSFCELPPLSEEFDFDIVRLHDFLMTYKSFFEKQGVLPALPSLDELQQAIKDFSLAPSTIKDKNKSLTLLNNIAVAMTRPLTPFLIKTLSSALTTNLNNEDENEDEDAPKQEKQRLLDPDDYSVTPSTWKEVVRLALIMDSLSEQGLTKIELTHVLRGYRSGGHPNSKEAKRIRRGEDSELVLRRQAMIINAEENNAGHSGNSNSIIVPAPCKPSVTSSHWTYYLHNIKSLPSNAASGMKSNLRKSQKVLKASPTQSGKTESYLSKLESNISLLDQIGTTYTSSSETIEVCKKVRKSVLRLLDRASGELFSTDEASEIVYRDVQIESSLDNKDAFAKLSLSTKSNRERGGIPADILITAAEYKIHTHDKEAYISAAIKLKEEQEHKEKCANAEDDDDDDDEDDDEEGTEEKKDTPEDAKSPQKNSQQEEKKVGLFKESIYDEFCADEPDAPQLLRRCLAVLRNLCQSSAAETFLYPVDPQTNLRYYESVMTPMSLYDVGRYLQNATKQDFRSESEIESVVAIFARKIRIIGKNVSCFTPVGGPLISTAEELLRIFERLCFDWILTPLHKIPPLETLDDDRCVEYDPSDDESMVLLCDGCEGKYNMSRLKPPLRSVPKGDWYCPRCRSGYCWALVDPRIGREVQHTIISTDGTSYVKGKVVECLLSIPEEGNGRSLNYVIRYEQGLEELWTLNEVDKSLKEAGVAVETIRCLEAVTESPGYGCGADSRLFRDVLPIQLDPKVSVSAAQRFLSSSVFRDTVLSCAALLVNDVDGMTSTDWTRLLNILMMKCMSSDTLQEVAGKIEDKANTELSEKLADVGKIKAVDDVLPQVTDDETEDTNDSETGEGQGQSPELSDQEKQLNRDRIVNLKLAKTRQKKRDDVFLASVIKRQIKPAIASLEEDKITMVINNALVSNDFGIDFATSRCPSQLCDFCGLSDISVGTPLVRYPNEIEWAESSKHLLRKRNTSLIAELNTSNPDNSSPTEKTEGSRTALVSVKLGGEIVCDDEKYTVDAPDQDISGYGLVPRNQEGFKRELAARANYGPPVLTGSLSVHDCCAQAAHKARIDRMIQNSKNHMSEEIERTQGNKCGKNISIGTDPQNRTYWKFESSPESLFVLNSSVGGKRQCLRFSLPETIASVILFLGKHKLAAELKRLYPQAFDLFKSGEWSELLQKKYFTLYHNREEKSCDMDIQDASSECDSISLDFNAGDEVLVQSVASGVLWDANIVAVAKRDESDTIIAYRMHYKEWSSRFDEWVTPSRVLEVSDENIEKQQKCSSNIADYEKDLSSALRNLKASAYLCSPHRARGFAKVPDFRRLLAAPSSATFEDKAIQELKAALLLVEVALPNGSLKAVWKVHTAQYWRSMLSKSTTPGNVMGCLVLLENAISKDWLRPNCEHLISCLPRHWKSINEASVSSIALRLGTLDRGLKYGMAKDDNGHWDNIDE